MAAPSPDWFINELNIQLCDENGWVSDKTVFINEAYDAGTDSGNFFEDEDSPTSPAEPIHRIGETGPMMVVRFTKDNSAEAASRSNLFSFASVSNAYNKLENNSTAI